MVSKKQKLDETASKSNISNTDKQELEEDDEEENEEENKNYNKADIEPMEVMPNSTERLSDNENIPEKDIKEQKAGADSKEGKEKTRTNECEENSSTASEDETDTQKTADTIESNIEPSDEEDVAGLLTASDPVVAATTLAAKGTDKQQEQQDQKTPQQNANEAKDVDHGSSSDEAAPSVYTIHKSSSSTSNTGGTGERLTVTLAKNSNKKTANDRQLAEHEKRCKMLHTMETYIRSILTLMQKDEEHSSLSVNNNEPGGDGDNDERLVTIPAITTLASSNIGIMDSESSSSDYSPTLGVPKSPSSTPPPLAPLSRGDCGLTIAKVTSTATISKTSNMSIEGEDEFEEDLEKESELTKSGSSIDSLIENGDDVNEKLIQTNVATIVSNMKSKNAAGTNRGTENQTETETEISRTAVSAMETDEISSPASPADMLSPPAVDPTHL